MAGSNGRGKSGAATAQRTGGVVLPEGVTLDDEDGLRAYSFRSGDSSVSFEVAEEYRGFASVVFSVNGSYVRTQENPREGVALALRVRSVMRADAASRPDGFRYRTSAATGDGLGDIRGRLYTSIGFTAPGSLGGAQYAVVRNGRLTPQVN